MMTMMKTGRRAPSVMSTMRTMAIAAIVAVAATSVPAATLEAQWVRQYEQFYLEAPWNWTFRNNYQAADRLFNAFDYGHAILYEKLWTKPNAPASELEQKEYDRLTKGILVRPPRIPLEEAAIEIKYVQLAPEAKLMFEWAHILHRQIYDVLATERLTHDQKDAEIGRLIAYYKTRPDLAFSSRPKSMALMQEQPYSLAFRQKYPKFNGLIWGYHWLQVGLYEPLLVGRTSEERQAGVRATTARFWQMLARPVEGMPHQMPMTAAIAPQFAARYQEAAIIFDNLHSMHDVISDILANPSVPRDRKRAEIMRAARLYRDDTSYVMTVPAWRTMTAHMGVENMGGPSVGFLPSLPTPTVTYGAVMSHDDATGEMVGFKYGNATSGSHAGHGGGAAAPGAPMATPSADPHAGHGATPAAGTPARTPPAGVDPHAGHAMPPAAAPATPASPAAPRSATDPHAGHPMPANAAPTGAIPVQKDPVVRGAHGAPAATRPSATNGRAKPAARPTPKAPAKAPAKASVRAPAKAPAKAPVKAPDPHAGHRPPADV